MCFAKQCDVNLLPPPRFCGFGAKTQSFGHPPSGGTPTKPVTTKSKKKNMQFFKKKIHNSLSNVLRTAKKNWSNFHLSCVSFRVFCFRRCNHLLEAVTPPQKNKPHARKYAKNIKYAVFSWNQGKDIFWSRLGDPPGKLFRTILGLFQPMISHNQPFSKHFRPFRFSLGPFKTSFELFFGPFSAIPNNLGRLCHRK